VWSGSGENTGLLILSPDGRWLAQADGSRVRQWRLPGPRQRADLLGWPRVSALAYGTDGRAPAVAAGGEGTVWDAANRRRLGLLRENGAVPGVMAFRGRFLCGNSAVPEGLPHSGPPRKCRINGQFPDIFSCQKMPARSGHLGGNGRAPRVALACQTP